MSPSPEAHDATLRSITTVVYALQAAAFVVGITFIAAVIVNYIKRSDVAGTIYASHFDWQIRTFWWALVWGFLAVLTFVFGVGILIGIGAGIWAVYRIVKGWLT